MIFFACPFGTWRCCVQKSGDNPVQHNMASICWQHQTLAACCFNWDQSSFSSSGKDFKASHNIFYMSLLFTWQDASYLSYLNHDVYEQSDGNEHIAALSLVITASMGALGAAQLQEPKPITAQRMLQFVNMIFIHFKSDCGSHQFRETVSNLLSPNKWVSPFSQSHLNIYTSTPPG